MTSARKPIVGGNWKMNTTFETAHALARAVAGGAGELAASIDIVIFPPLPYVRHVRELLRESPVGLGVQNLYPERNGAFTGEVGLEMILDLRASHVLIGHSERRHVIGESNDLIQRKLRVVLDAGLTAVLCIGETLEQREAGKTESVNLAQLDHALEGIPTEQLDRLVIAYEPVWAIGTGRTATPDDAQTVHRTIRLWLQDRYTESVGGSIRIQYGGSVKPDNAAALFAQPDIDGFLVGGASLTDADFLAIAHASAAGS
jgi:triosephosphate isomerase (TIM)